MPPLREYTGQIVVDRAGGAVDTYRLELTKPDNQAKLKGSVSGVGFLTGTPDFDGFISGQKEGTLFQVDQDGGVTGETAVGPECTQYQAFVTKDTETVKINKGLQAFELFPQSSVDKKPALVDFYVNGTLSLQGADSPTAMAFAMKVAQEQISFVEDTASFTFVVYEEENHNITTEYQFRIDRLDTEAGDLPQLTAVTVENGVFQNGQEFDPTVYQYVIGHGKTIESLTFTLEAADTVSLYLGGELAADKLLARGQDGKYSVTASTSEPLKILAASKTEVNGMEVVNQVVYTFQFSKIYDNQGEGTHEPGPPHPVPDIDIVDRIIDYCPAPATAYVPDNPEPVESGAYDDQIYSGKTAWSRFICLGGFGGYMTFAFDTPIVNDPNNPYGIDFIVYGNGFGNSEPGNVLVSQDGVTWYTLAGSMHYELTTDWNKSAKLINGSTVQAVQIATDESGTANVSPLLPIYGYMDNYPCSENANAEGSYDVTAVPGNPYDKRVERNSIIGDGFDLTWAVDANGKPVELDGIAYIRVQNAVDLTTGFGTTSPEMGTLVRTKANEAATGVTDGLATLTVNGLDILGQTPTETAYDGQVRYYEISLSDASAASLQIVAEGGAEDNITINNEQYPTGAAQANLLLAEDGSRMAKIIVQNGEKQPVSYVIKCTGGGDPDVNADLASVVLTPGDVVGQWEDGGYRFEVANGVESVSLNATALNPAATVLLNGTQIASGVDSEPFSVAVGKNQATITVTSVDGSVTKTYPVEITRAAKDSSGDEDEISVVFTLKGDTKHGENGKHAAETWIKTTAVRVPEGSTVKYLTDMMLYNAGLSVRTTDGGTYIAEINGLAEMDNGPNSGWMYRMNGYIEDVGYADRVLERGDRVEWFYTDDYTKETNYKGNWGSSGSSSVTQTSADGILSFNAGGTVTPADLTDYVGKDVTLTFQPDSGYQVKDVIVDGKSLGSITAYTYQDLKKTSTIQVVFEKIPAQQLSFSDVPSSHWAAEYIYGLAEAGLMQGTAATTFSPEAKITRGEFVAVLARMSGDELPEYTGQFSDVTADAWYSPYVAWAVYTGVTQGVSDSSFAPLENISRQDLAVMLSRYLEIENVQPATTVEAQSFEDEELIASYAQAAVKQMQQLEIINGKENNLFAPTDATTRAEAAKMLYGVFQLLAE